MGTFVRNGLLSRSLNFTKTLWNKSIAVKTTDWQIQNLQSISSVDLTTFKTYWLFNEGLCHTDPVILY